MKIEVTLGCMENNFTIDGKTVESSNPNLDTICHDVILSLPDSLVHDMFCDVLCTLGEYKEDTQDYYDTFDGHEFRMVDNENGECILIDDKHFSEYSPEYIKNLLADYTLAKADKQAYDILLELVEHYGEVNYEYTCSTCGDSVYTYTIEL